MPRGGGGGVRRAGIGIVDQIFYNASNFILTVLVARSSTPVEFGGFALIFTTWTISNSTCRGLTSETLVVRYSAATRDEWREGTRNCSGASMVLGLIIGVGAIAVGIVLGGFLGASLAIMGICIPGMFQQDMLRFASFALGKPIYALISDVLVMVVLFGTVAVLTVLDAVSVPTLVAAWGGAGIVGGIVIAIQLRITANPARARAWFRRDGDLATRYAADDLASNVGQQLPTYVVAGVAGLSGTAALRGAQSVFGPPSIISLGIQASVTPELVRGLKRSSTAFARSVVLLAIGMALVGTAWGVAAMLCPDSLGKHLYGETWLIASPLFAYFTVNQAANGLRIAPTVGLRAMGAANRTLGARVVAVISAIVLSGTGALIDGPRGAATGIASATLVSAAAYWWQFRQALIEHRAVVAVRRRDEAWEQLVASAPADASPIEAAPILDITEDDHAIWARTATATAARTQRQPRMVVDPTAGADAESGRHSADR